MIHSKLSQNWGALAFYPLFSFGVKSVIFMPVIKKFYTFVRTSFSSITLIKFKIPSRGYLLAAKSQRLLLEYSVEYINIATSKTPKAYRRKGLLLILGNI